MIRKFKQIVKNIRDWYWSKDLPSKKTIGTVDKWTILTDHIGKGIVYSGGVGKDITFETSLIEQYGAKIFAFDPSPTGIKTISNIKSYSQNLFFFPIGLSKTEGVQYFNPPFDPEEGSFKVSPDLVKGEFSFKCKPLSKLMKENNHNHIDILKIDIEGSEYDVIEDIIENKLDIKQICVEFHHFFSTIPKSRTKKSIESLTKVGYMQFHKTDYDYSFIKL